MCHRSIITTIKLTFASIVVGTAAAYCIFASPKRGLSKDCNNGLNAASIRQSGTPGPVTRTPDAFLQGCFGPSLEARENTDFLLTPGLLVQQAISGVSAFHYPAD
jgi:hypothetical protein